MTKSNMLIIFIQSIIFTLCVGISALSKFLPIASPTKTPLCQAVEQGKYNEINKLLEPNNDFGEITIKDGGFLMTGKQLEKISLITTKCVLKTNPFTEIFVWYAEATDKLLN